MNKCPVNHLARKDLPPLTDRIARLPVDPERGYPIPFFVTMLDGKPEFRLADGQKYARCIRDKLCWVCGEPMGVYKAFVIGPMCCINRISGDPPSHKECAEWSVRGCPFLTKPQMVRRTDELTEANKKNVSGIMIERNPGVMAIWTTRVWKLLRDHGKGYLFSLGHPESVSFWREGRIASRAEILHSVNTGFPILYDMAKAEGEEAIEELTKAKEVALQLLPY